MRPSRWSPGLLVQVVLLAGYLAVALTGVLSAEQRSVVSCALLLQSGLYAARCAAGVGVRATAPRHRWAWRLLATGCLAWSLTQAYWTWLEVRASAPPVLLDAVGTGYAALPLLALPALRMLVTSSSARGGLLVRLLDALALSGAVVILGWTLALEDALRQDRSFPILFAVGDVVIAIAVVALLARFAGAVTRPVSLAAGGLLVVATTDITYVGRALHDEYVTGTWLDAGWMLGFLLIALGAHTEGAPEVPGGRAAHRFQLLLPYLPVSLAVGLTGQGIVRHEPADPVVLTLALLVVVVSSLRQGLTLAHNADLIDELAEREVDLLRRARQDPLTGLGNRTLLVERLEAALEADAPRLALLYVDLDDFKLINDTHGHDAGDAVLVEVARRLAALAAPGDTVARLGGDEFALLVLGRPGQAVADQLLVALQHPVRVGARRFLVNGSVGLVRAEGADETAGTLLSHADIAMYTAKGSGKGRISAVHGGDRAEAVRKTRIRELVAHPRPEDFSVVYQPVVDLRDGRLRGVEALVRWHHPDVGDVSPAEFIHLAEQAGSIGVIGQHVLETALRDLAGWSARFPERRLAVGVNVSPVQLRDHELVAHAVAEVAAHGLSSDQLVLEITEEALVGDIDQAAAAVAALRAEGISVAIDDFGTGYSSFRYLDRFQADVLKIDRSFVAKMGTSPRTRELVRSVNDLGRMLDLQTIAEGVETLADLQLLREMGCELAQGFLFSRPVPAREITALLALGGRFPVAAAVVAVPPPRVPTAWEPAAQMVRKD